MADDEVLPIVRWLSPISVLVFVVSLVMRLWCYRSIRYGRHGMVERYVQALDAKSWNEREREKECL